MFSVLFACVVAAAPEVAVLSSKGDQAALRFQPVGSSTVVEPVASFTHAEGSAVLGSLLPGTRVVVASATVHAQGDLSFANALIRLEAGQPARVLADQLVYGARPLVTPEGRVFVARGRAGVERGARMRVDALTVDEIDPSTGQARLVYSVAGYGTFLAGALGRELILYEVTETGARLLAVHVDTLAVRVVLRALVPMARDFVVDAPRRRVLFTQVQGDHWRVDEVSLRDGAQRVLVEGPEVTLLPTVRADGRVLISAGAGQGLRALDGKEGLASRGPGFERVRFERAGLILGLHETPSDFPSLVGWRGAERLVVPTPAESRLDLAGVIP